MALSAHKTPFGHIIADSGTSGTTEYWHIWGRDTVANDPTESAQQGKIRTAGTVTNFRLIVNSNTISDVLDVVTRVNGGDGNMGFSIPASTTGRFDDDTGSDSISAGDLYCVEMAPAASGSFTIWAFNFIFNTTGSDAVTLLGSQGNSGASTASNDYYQTLNATPWLTNNTYIDGLRFTADRAATFRNLLVNISGNDRSDSSSTITLYKNDSDSSLTVTVPADTTGWFEDTSNTVSAAASDTFCHHVVTGTGTGTMTIRSIMVEHVTTDDSSLCLLQNYKDSTTISTGTTYYLYPNGYLWYSTISTTHAIRVPSDIVLDDYKIEIYANSTSVTSTFDFLVGDTFAIQETGLSVSVTSSSTGSFTDSTATATLKGVYMQNRVVLPSGSGTMTIANAQIYVIEQAEEQAGSTLSVSSGCSTVSTANTTQYYSLPGGNVPDTTEANKQSVYRTAGTLSHFHLYLSTNTTSGGDLVFKLRKNGSDGNEVITLPEILSTGIFLDVSGSTDSVADGDKLCVVGVPPSSGVYIMRAYGFMFEPTDTDIVVSKFTMNLASTASTTINRIVAPNGRLGTTTTINSYITMEVAGTIRDIGAYISGNDCSGDSTVSTWVNGSAGSLSVTISGSSTGWFEDNSTNESLSVDDTLAIRWAAGSGGSTGLTVETITSELETAASGGYSVVMHGASVSVSVPDNTVRYQTVTYYDYVVGLTALRARTYFDFSIKAMQTTVISNTLTTSSTTYALRIDETENTNAKISVTAGSTGVFSTSGLDEEVLAGQSLTTIVTIPNEGTSGTIQEKSFSVWITNVLAGAPVLYERSASDSLTIAAVLTTLTTKIRTLSDSLTSSDAISDILRTVPRTPSETVVLDAPVTRLAIMSRTPSETAQVDSALDRIAYLFRTISETPTISDVVDRVYTAVKALPETVTISAPVTRTATLLRTLPQTLVIDAPITSLITYVRQLDETLQVSDLVENFLVTSVELFEGVTIDAVVSKWKIFVRTIDDALSIDG